MFTKKEQASSRAKTRQRGQPRSQIDQCRRSMKGFATTGESDDRTAGSEQLGHWFSLSRLEQGGRNNMDMSLQKRFGPRPARRCCRASVLGCCLLASLVLADVSSADVPERG